MSKASVGTVKKSASPKSRKIIAYIVLILLTLLCLIWFYLLIINTTRSHSSIVNEASFLPSNQFINNLQSVWNDSSTNIFRSMLNSFIVAASTAVVSTYFSTLTAYAIHAYDFKLKKVIFTFILMIMMIPSQVTTLGFIDWLRDLKLTDNYIPLIVPSIAAPVTFYYLKQYMESALPMALIEAARIDGSGEFRTFNTIALPLMKPAIAVQAIFTFVSSWNNYFVPSFVIVKNKALRTVPVVLATLRSKPFNELDQGQCYMTICMSILPVVVVYFFLAKNIVGGLALGSVKG